MVYNFQYSSILPQDQFFLLQDWKLYKVEGKFTTRIQEFSFPFYIISFLGQICHKCDQT